MALFGLDKQGSGGHHTAACKPSNIVGRARSNALPPPTYWPKKFITDISSKTHLSK